MPRELAINLLHRAVWAPSGDNSQPWKFSVDSFGSITIINCPEKDNAILNYEQTGSYVSHGAVIQNIRLLSKVAGYNADVSLFPSELNYVAIIKFIKTDNPATQLEIDLASVIESRSTNRRKYSSEPLSSDELSKLQIAAEDATKNVQFKFSINDINKKRVAEALAVMEDIALQVPSLHGLFFKDIIWNKSESESGKPGLYLKSLELPLPAQFGMKYLVRHWSITRMLNKYIGLSHRISLEMSRVYAATDKFGAIFVSDRSSKSYIAVGEVMQRVWLEATLLGVAVEPVTGLFFLVHRATDRKLAPIPTTFTDQIMSSYSQVLDAFPKSESDIAFLLRFGHSKPPTAKSKRLPPVIV